MGRNEWEHGEIVLPSAEFAKVRQTMQQAVTAHKEKVFDLSQEFWKGLSRKQQTDPDEYRKAGHEFIAARQRDDTRHNVYGTFGTFRSNGYNGEYWRRKQQEDRAANRALSDMAEATRIYETRTKPARVLKTDMDFPTNRTTDFDAGGYVIFDKARNTVSWDVYDNNNAVDRARSHPMANTFFEALDKVAWTRGTGGVFTGNDEYSREDDSEGGGANYVTTAFGPVGAEQSPTHCRPYTDSKGVRVTERDLEQMSKARFMAEMEAQRQAQAAYAKAMKASTVQPRGHKGHAGQYTYRDRGRATFSL